MRFLGPDADASDELATFDQLPTQNSYTAVVTSDITLTTSVATMASVTLPSGTYAIQSTGFVSGTSTNAEWTIDTSGGSASGTMYGFRYAGSAIVTIPGTALGSAIATSSTTPQGITLNGLVVVSSTTTLRLRCRRTGTSGVCEAGSQIMAVRQ